MKTKWYYSILIVAFILLAGNATKQHIVVPNQEIVLQFSAETVSSHDAQNTICLVKQQLESVGVENIQIKEYKDGYLKITYYSDSDVESIKQILSEDNLEALEYVSTDGSKPQAPSKDSTVSYDLDVYEIHQSDNVSDLEGKLALETKAEHDRLYNPNLFVPHVETNHKEQCNSVKVAYKYNRTIALAIVDYRSQKIPEVRAGPSPIGTYNHTIS